MIRISSKYLGNLTGAERRNFSSLTFRHVSGMREALQEIDRPGYSRDRVFLAKEGEGVLGWALCLQHSSFLRNDLRNEVHVFVASKHRRKGIGTRLVNNCIRYVKKTGRLVNVIAHDDSSSAFYANGFESRVHVHDY